MGTICVPIGAIVVGGCQSQTVGKPIANGNPCLVDDTNGRSETGRVVAGRGRIVGTAIECSIIPRSFPNGLIETLSSLHVGNDPACASQSLGNLHTTRCSHIVRSALGQISRQGHGPLAVFVAVIASSRILDNPFDSFTNPSLV